MSQQATLDPVDFRTTPEYLAAHNARGECKKGRDCIDRGWHTKPEPLRGPRTAPDGRRFTWGPIDAIHTVGDYQIVEYREDQSNHSASQPYCWDRHGRTVFHPYVNGASTHTSYRTLDSALVGAIAYKREGPNGRAAGYFDRMTLPASELE